MVIWRLCLHNNVYNVERMIKDLEHHGRVIFNYGNNSKVDIIICSGDPIHIYYKNQRVFVGKVNHKIMGGCLFNYDKYYRRAPKTSGLYVKHKECRVDVQIIIEEKGDMAPLVGKTFRGIDIS